MTFNVLLQGCPSHIAPAWWVDAKVIFGRWAKAKNRSEPQEQIVAHVGSHNCRQPAARSRLDIPSEVETRIYKSTQAKPHPRRKHGPQSAPRHPRSRHYNTRSAIPLLANSGKNIAT